MKPVITISKPSEIREFSVAYEVDKLKRMLQLPVTNIVFDERYEYGKLYLDGDMNLTVIYGQLYINNELIGTIPYMSDKWGPMYDNSKIELAWDKIYMQFREVIFGKIMGLENLAVNIEIANDAIKRYRVLTLHVKDKDGTQINTALCNYINDEWTVVLIGLNPVFKTKVVNVTILPPPIRSDL